MTSRANNAVVRDLALILGLGLLLIGTGLGLRDPWPADEPRFALIARDMVSTGEWLFPRVGGDLYPDKPPLFMWLIAAFYWLTGSLRIAFLLPSLLAALGTLTLVYDLGRRLWTREAGRAAALALLFTIQFTLQAKRAQIDATLVFFTTLSFYALLRHLLLGGSWRWLLLGGFASGLGVITKGVGFLPLLVLLPYAYLRWRNRKSAGRAPQVDAPAPRPAWTLSNIHGGWTWSAIPLGFIAAIGLWFFPMVAASLSGDPGHVAYRNEILFHQTVTRYAAAWHHHQPFYYYFVVILPLWLPLIAAVPWLVPRWKERLHARDARVLLPLAWVLLVLLFFTASPGKRDVYILPALPVLALVCGEWLHGLWQGRAVRRIALTWACLMAAVWLTASVAVVLKLNPKRSAQDFIATVEATADPTKELGLLAYKEQFLLYFRRPTTNFGHARWREGPQESYDAARWLNASPNRQLLLEESQLKPCFATSPRTEVGKTSGDRWFLVSPPASNDCAQHGDPTKTYHYHPPAK